MWKIARQTGDYRKFLRLHSTHLIQRSSTLSVSCDGQELLILACRSLEIYRVLGSAGTAQKQPFLDVQLPSDIDDLLHAVATSSGHFIILHSLKQVAETERSNEKKKRMYAVSKVAKYGRLVVRRFILQNETQQLALDSDDRVFVADRVSGRVIFLDSDLRWIQILCPMECEVERIVKLPHRL